MSTSCQCISALVLRSVEGNMNSGLVQPSGRGTSSLSTDVFNTGPGMLDREIGRCYVCLNFGVEGTHTRPALERSHPPGVAVFVGLLSSSHGLLLPDYTGTPKFWIGNIRPFCNSHTPLIGEGIHSFIIAYSEYNLSWGPGFIQHLQKQGQITCSMDDIQRPCDERYAERRDLPCWFTN